MHVFLRAARRLVGALTYQTTPRQLALGFALGMLVGLVPKGNLTAMALMLLLCASKVNLGVATFSALIFSWTGLLADPVTHTIGLALLTTPSLQPLWIWLYNTPIVPWTDFNNTVVLGSFVTGTALLLPVYLVCRPAFERLTPVIQARAKRFRIVRLLWGAELAQRLNEA